LPLSLINASIFSGVSMRYPSSSKLLRWVVIR
jgi:hypothetical protein